MIKKIAPHFKVIQCAWPQNELSMGFLSPFSIIAAATQERQRQRERQRYRYG